LPEAAWSVILGAPAKKEDAMIAAQAKAILGGTLDVVGARGAANRLYWRLSP
jgi:hypothetical protein